MLTFLYYDYRLYKQIRIFHHLMISFISHLDNKTMAIKYLARGQYGGNKLIQLCDKIASKYPNNFYRKYLISKIHRDTISLLGEMSREFFHRYPEV